MLILQNISYAHPNKDLLFEHINLTVKPQDKIALIGNNGSGKSTLLKLITKDVQPLEGLIDILVEPYYVPQILGQYDHLTIAEVLKVEGKLNALKEILNGQLTEVNYTILDDDWSIEERCKEALAYWQLSDIDLSQKMQSLSGGQKTKVFLAGLFIQQAKLVLLDEPSNHLDLSARQLLYDYIQSTKSTILVVSHDRKLLNLLGIVCELNPKGISIYGGNFDFYMAQKQIENNAISQELQSKEKALRKAREKERATVERQQKLDSRGKSKQEKSGVAKIMMNTLRNNAEKSTAKIKEVHAEKTGGIAQELKALRATVPDIDKMKFGFQHSALHKGKILIKATDINFSYQQQMLWKIKLSFQIASGERIAIKGPNGSGKTTLIKLLLGKLKPQEGTLYCAHNKSIYIDQDYSLLDKQKNVYAQAQQFNLAALQEHEIKIRLHRFLFRPEDWDKSCTALSGGEKMRLMLCCLTISQQAPDIIILDEPSNNLDLQNINILTAAINDYQGTLIVVTHDEVFLEQLNIKRSIQL